MTQRSSQKRWDLELHLGRSLDWCLLVTMELKFDTVISMVWMDVHLTAGNSVHVDRKTLWNWSVVENCEKKHYLRKMNLISKDLDTYCWIKHNFLYYLKEKKKQQLYFGFLLILLFQLLHLLKAVIIRGWIGLSEKSEESLQCTQCNAWNRSCSQQ